jgi:ion channel-forming bestrophin family protein
LEAFHRSHRISILPARQSNLGAPTSIQSPTTTTTALNEVSSVPRDDGSGISYSERSRPYRRDVFSYDDWVRHRSSERFTGRLKKLTKSGIARALTDEVLLLAAVATFICTFNALLVVGFDDFANVHHDPLINLGLPLLSLPAMFFTLSSPALSLLLGMSKLRGTFLMCALELLAAMNVFLNRSFIYSSCAKYL